jgi:hypothetical protein
MVNRPFPKLAFKFYGPYKVLERVILWAIQGVGETGCSGLSPELELPIDAQIHPVFHVSELKSFTPSYSPVFSSLPHCDGQKAGQKGRPNSFSWFILTLSWLNLKIIFLKFQRLTVSCFSNFEDF